MIMIVQLLSIATVFATGDTGGTPYDASSGSSLSVLHGPDNKIPFIPMSAVTSGSFMTLHGCCRYDSCVESTDHKNGGGIHMYDCDSSNWNQRWTWTSSGQIKLLGTEWCLDGQPENWGTVHLWTCGYNNWNQMWTYNDRMLCLKQTGYCLTTIYGGLTVMGEGEGRTLWNLEYGNDYTNLPTSETQSAAKLSSVKMSARTLSGSGGNDGTPSDNDAKRATATPTPSAEPMLAPPEPEVSPMDRMFTELARVRIGDKVCFERLVAKLSRTSCSALASVLPEVPCARDYVQPEFEMIAEYVCRYMGDVDFSKTMHDRSFPDLS